MAISEYAGGNLPTAVTTSPRLVSILKTCGIASACFQPLSNTVQSAEYFAAAAKQVKWHQFKFVMVNFTCADRPEGKFPLASAWALRFDISSAIGQIQSRRRHRKRRENQHGGVRRNAFYSGLLNAGGGDFVVRDLARYRPMCGGRIKPLGRLWRCRANHAWTAIPATVSKYMLGFNPPAGGFATFDVRPETGGLTFAEGAVPTVRASLRPVGRKAPRASSRSRFTFR